MRELDEELFAKRIVAKSDHYGEPRTLSRLCNQCGADDYYHVGVAIGGGIAR